jgi:hypothetical protein
MNEAELGRDYLGVLSFLCSDGRDHLDKQAGEYWKEAVGVCTFLKSHDGDLARLSSSQRRVFDYNIAPLVFVSCEGPVGLLDETGLSSCVSECLIEPERLVSCYLTETFLCSSCLHDAERIDLE